MPVAAASVRLTGLDKTAVTNDSGRAVVHGVPAGKQDLVISAVGYITLSTTLQMKADTPIFTFTLKKDTVVLDDVAVFGYAPALKTNRQTFNVTAIDAKKLHNSTLDIAHVLNRVPGARLRETGGVGSDFDLSLNGFSGKRIKYFIDGVPIDYLGAAFQVNNIPVNFAERIEVYKGVIPVWLGSDALGGAVNIVTNQGMRNYLDVSYSYGSFNTHRSYINAGYTARNGFTVRLNAFQNYSDNNYKVTVDAADIHTGKYYPDTTVRRFHDQYDNETAIAQLGFVDKKWADQLLAGITVGKYYKEIQTGARLTTVFGALHNKGTILMPALVYKKNDLFTKGLNASLNANYNLGEEQSIDTVHARYNWLKDSITYRGKGGERAYQWYQYKNNTANAAASITYQVSNRHFFALNNVYSHFDRKGCNIVSPHAMLDNIPQQSNKNISGLGYQYKNPNNWDISVFGKYLLQRAHTTLIETDFTRPGDTTYNRVSKNIDRIGYGVAGTYFITPDLQWKLSYENTYRLPESEDLFGDVTNKDGNWNLKPESGKNFNLGFNYTHQFGTHRLCASATGVYSYVNDYIYYTFNGYTNKLYPDNLLKVSNLGIESEIRYSFKQLLAAGINLTYQNIRDQQKYRTDMQGEIPSNTYKERIPNVPYLFGNADATLYFNKLFNGSDRLSIGYNGLYVHEFYLYWANEGAASTKRTIPEQLAHDVNLVYTLKDGKYNIAFECKDITDKRLYDNYSLQKPGRSFNIKLRYFIHK
ncbi:TonB-dependent receptor [Niabella aquatica]